MHPILTAEQYTVNSAGWRGDSEGCNLPEDSEGCNLLEDSEGCNLPEDSEGCNLLEDSEGSIRPMSNKANFHPDLVMYIKNTYVY